MGTRLNTFSRLKFKMFLAFCVLFAALIAQSSASGENDFLPLPSRITRGNTVSLSHYKMLGKKGPGEDSGVYMRRAAAYAQRSKGKCQEDLRKRSMYASADARLVKPTRKYPQSEVEQAVSFEMAASLRRNFRTNKQ